MSAIVKGVGDLVASVVEIFKGLIEGIFTLIQTAFSTVASLIGSFFDLFQGLVGFILGAFISKILVIHPRETNLSQATSSSSGHWQRHSLPMRGTKLDRADQ